MTNTFTAKLLATIASMEARTPNDAWLKKEVMDTLKGKVLLAAHDSDELANFDDYSFTGAENLIDLNNAMDELASERAQSESGDVEFDFYVHVFIERSDDIEYIGHYEETAMSEYYHGDIEEHGTMYKGIGW